MFIGVMIGLSYSNEIRGFSSGTVFSVEETLKLHREGKKMKHNEFVNPLPAYGRLHNTHASISPTFLLLTDT